MDEIRIKDYYDRAISIADEIYWKLVESGIKGVERDDLVQEALLGLVEAKRKFDPEKGVKFAAYAFPRDNKGRVKRGRVRGAIIDFLRRLDWLPQDKREILKRYQRAKEELIQELEREPTRGEIAEELGISEEDVRKIEKLELFVGSLDEPHFTDDESEVNILDTISSDIKPPDVVLEDEERNKAINSCIEGLPSPEKEIIEQRYYEGKTLKEVAESLDMPLSTTQRKEKEAERRLKDCMEKKGWGQLNNTTNEEDS
ncbi:sigma-70 family RNA polymerase sigma factor [bacterium]|nr:sigma-70 family RNA polymerase sigma factor [bacterium]MBU1615677.1 sigma-70 family RNA polymerase sigma factor [bacterium]